MVVMQVLRSRARPGSTVADILACAKAGKKVIMKHGAIYVGMDQIYFGEPPNDWLFSARWPSMSDYGKSIDSLMKDPEFLAVYVRFGELVELQERYLMMSYDLDS